MDYLFSFGWTHEKTHERFLKSGAFLLEDRGERVKKVLPGFDGQRQPYRGETRAYGVPLEELGLVVLDIDQHGPDGEESLKIFLDKYHINLPETLTVTTPTGGRHIYFRVPEGMVVETLAGVRAPIGGVDLLGNDGEIWTVGPGSIITNPKFSVTDGLYRVTVGLPPAPLPSELVPALQQEWEETILRRYPGLALLEKWQKSNPVDRLLLEVEWVDDLITLVEVLTALDYSIAKPDYNMQVATPWESLCCSRDEWKDKVEVIAAHATGDDLIGAFRRNGEILCGGSGLPALWRDCFPDVVFDDQDEWVAF